MQKVRDIAAFSLDPHPDYPSFFIDLSEHDRVWFESASRSTDALEQIAKTMDVTNALLAELIRQNQDQSNKETPQWKK